MKGQRLSPDWNPDQFEREWSAKRRPDLDIDEQVELFVNHWVAKTGQDATKLDWSRTWKNWIIRSYGPIKKDARAVEIAPQQRFHGSHKPFVREMRARVTSEPQAMKDLLAQMGIVKP